MSPHGVFDAGERAGQHRATTIELAAEDGLPVMLNACGVLANQVAADFVHGRGHGLRAPLDDRFAQPDDALVRVHLEEEPARTDKYGF